MSAFPAELFMPSSPKIISIMLIFLAVPVMAQDQVVVAVINDGPADRLEELHEKFVDELLALTASEFDVQIRYLSGQWSQESIDTVFAEAYADPEVGLVLVTGFIANQIAATKRRFLKPTFLPMIIDTGLLKDEVKIGLSGVANLNYLSVYADFADDLDALARIVPYRNLALFVDAGLSSAIPQLREAAFAASAERGIELLVVPHDGARHDAIALGRHGNVQTNGNNHHLRIGVCDRPDIAGCSGFVRDVVSRFLQIGDGP